MIFSREAKAGEGCGMAQPLRTKIDLAGQAKRLSEYRVAVLFSGDLTSHKVLGYQGARWLYT